MGRRLRKLRMLSDESCSPGDTSDGGWMVGELKLFDLKRPCLFNHGNTLLLIVDARSTHYPYQNGVY